MQLKCDLIIQNLNNPQMCAASQATCFGGDKVHKAATIGIYRPRLDDEYEDKVDKRSIIIIVETKSQQLKYKLARLDIQTRFINEGKASLKLVEQNVYLLISNAPSLTLINFVAFLRLKLAKSNAPPPPPQLTNTALTTTTTSNNKENNSHMGGTQKYVNKLLSSVQCTIAKSSLAAISPLCEKEVNDAMLAKSRQQQQKAVSNESPIRAGGVKPSSSFMRSASSANLMPSHKSNSSSSSSGVSSSPGASRFAASKQTSASTSNLLVQLTDEQQHILKAIREHKKNVFLTGSGGSGKSFLLNVIRKCLPSETCFVTASTGVAASLIGGTTLHSFAGLAVDNDNNSNNTNTKLSKAFSDTNLLRPAGEDNNNSGGGGEESEKAAAADRRRRLLTKILNAKDKLANWRKCKQLVIDEISMVDGDTFDELEFIARSIKNNDQPFGGIQLVLSGDFYQLPPVSTRHKKRKYAFESNAWSRCVHMPIQLTKVNLEEKMNKSHIQIKKICWQLHVL